MKRHNYGHSFLGSSLPHSIYSVNKPREWNGTNRIVDGGWMASQDTLTVKQRNLRTLGLSLALQGGIYRLNCFEPRPYNRNVPLSSFCLNINFSFDSIHMSEYDFMLEYYLGGLKVKILILLTI